MNQLKIAWEEYLKTSDRDALLFAIEEHAIPLPAKAEYPHLHRICDVQIGANAYRVMRLADELETLFICLCDTPNLDLGGVPYWLHGEKLQLWIRLETGVEEDDRFQPETDVDWNIFR